MAHFIGTVQGSGGEASRMGTKRSGLTTDACGWHVGAKVDLRHDEATGEDIVTVYLTGGSAPSYSAKFLGEYREADLAKVR